MIDKDTTPQDLHNEGLSDASKGEYHPPPNPGFLDAVAEAIDPLVPSVTGATMIEEREAYDKGYEEGRKN